MRRCDDRGDDTGRSKEREEMKSSVDGGDGDCQKEGMLVPIREEEKG